jgi:dienelactone hydrolase
MRFFLALVCVAACSDPDVAPDMSVEQHGPYSAGTARFTKDGRTFQSFYPTDTAEADVAIESLEEEPHRTQYADLLATADPTCPTRTLSVAVDAPPAAGAFPLVVVSHCHTCTRLNLATVSARLASHGFVVVSVDHDGATLWNALAQNNTGLTAEALDARIADMQAALAIDDASLASADRTRIGSLGHSFGSVTAGKLAVVDDRIQATFGLDAPIDSPFFPGVGLPEVPLAFFVAREDNSISEFGNDFIRDNYTDAPKAAWKYEIADAGHWSVSDLVGLVDGFHPGCGMDERQTDGAPFTYLGPATGRAITAAYVTAFFRATLDDDPGSRAYLARGFPDDEIVDAVHHD